MPEIISETQGPIRILTISNQRKRNAFEGSMATDFHRLLEEAEADPAIRVVVVTGDGEIAFSSGHDLAELADGHEGNVSEEPFLYPLETRTPVIAAVNGHCYAAALILASSCDLRVVSENATFGSPGARLGMLPEGGQIGRLPGMMSRCRALELMLTADPMSAAEAFRAGFVNRVVPTGRALAEALVLARAVAKNAPAAVSAIKAGVLLGERRGIEAAARYELETAPRLARGRDAKEGVKAFFEKRAPIFLGN